MSDRVEKRYQVFVSSTFEDLQDERQEVMQALLELDCIPSGMELFPAANQDQWDLIKRVIDDCDYYVVISAGRYGSVGQSGIGYTEMEYRYAAEKQKPIIGFLYRDLTSLSAGRSEATDEGKARLKTFRELIAQKPVRFWDSPADLGSKVSRSLVNLIKTEPAVGWVRANALASEDATREILGLRKRIEELREELADARLSPPVGSESLAQGEDELVIDAWVEAETKSGDGEYKDGKLRYGFVTTWDAVFAAVAPTMIDEASDYQLETALKEFVNALGPKVLETDDEITSYDSDLDTWSLVDSHVKTIKIQLRALGLITKSTKPHSVRDRGTYWTLTPLGDERMTRLRAIKRDIGAGPIPNPDLRHEPESV